jgi:small-conductance mechanosensitive channel/CRP-like cAMP-binding protein
VSDYSTSPPTFWLTLASILMLAVAIDMRWDRERKLWARFSTRVFTFAIATWLMQRAVISPLAPQLSSATATVRIWALLVEIGWWLLGARVAVGLVRLVVVLEHRPRETKMISDLLAGLIYVATTLAVVNFVFGVAIAGLVATSGVLAILLGLALQSTLSDVFSGLAVGLERPYKPGDVIWVEGGIEGQVIQINWRSTQITTINDSVAIVPNSVIAKSRLENRSAPTPTRSVTVTVHIEASIDPRRVLATMRAAALSSRHPLAAPAFSVECVNLSGDGNSYEVRFVVMSSDDVRPARTDMLAQIHRHFRHAGIGFGVTGVEPLPPARPPTLDDMLAASDAFGALAPPQRDTLAGNLALTSFAPDQTLLREGECADAVYLLTEGTVEISQPHGDGRRVLLHASPGDTVGMLGLITGLPSLVAARTLTPVTAYRLAGTSLSALLREHPELAAGLETAARRGEAWLRCELVDEHATMTAKPEFLLARLRDFLHRLNA